MAPGTSPYQVPLALRLVGALDLALLQHSLTALVQRHESLRTTVVLLHGYPMQHISPPSAVPLPLLDLRALPAPAQSTLLAQHQRAAALRPFDLQRGPLLRLSLLVLADTSHVLLLTFHHLVFDEWSLAIFTRDLSALYSAAQLRRPPALPALPIQYADYALWQRHWLQGAVLSQHLAYWTTHLRAAPAFLDLPTDRPRPAIQRFQGAVHAFTLPPALHHACSTSADVPASRCS